jgi:TetR/AcrR family transcriptional repressor of nem operon
MHSINTNQIGRRRGRPPKAAKGYSETREGLLQAGVEALTEKGFSATGIEEILSKVSVPKGSFYNFFESKEGFVLMLVERYANYFARKLDRFLLNEEQAPLLRLESFVADARNGMERYEYRRGCLVGNLGQEMGALPISFRKKITEVFIDWEGRVAVCLELAKHRGELASDADCTKLATCFWIGWEGAVLRAKLEVSPTPLDIFADFFFAGLPR